MICIFISRTSARSPRVKYFSAMILSFQNSINYLLYHCRYFLCCKAQMLVHKGVMVDTITETITEIFQLLIRIIEEMPLVIAEV